MLAKGIFGAGRAAVLLLLTGLLATDFASAADQDDSEFDEGWMRISAGLDYSVGDYDQPKSTASWYLPLKIQYGRGPWTYQLTIPYLRIKGPGNVVGGTIPSGSSGADRITQQGLGDITVGVSYEIYPSNPLLPLIGFSGKVKFATADEDEGLGTGENDYRLELELLKSFGRFTPFGSVGYRLRGELFDESLNNTVFASVGVGWRFTQLISGGLSYDFKEAASRAADDAHDLVPFFSVRISETMTLGTYTIVGLTDQAPDFEMGFNVGVSW